MAYERIGWSPETDGRPPDINGANLKKLEDNIEGISQFAEELSDTTNQKINDVFNIGDIKVSARPLENITNGKFLTCDGRLINGEAYPELTAAIGGRFGGYKFSIMNEKELIPDANRLRGGSSDELWAQSESGELTTCICPGTQDGGGIWISSYNASGTRIRHFQHKTSVGGMSIQSNLVGLFYVGVNCYVLATSTTTSTLVLYAVDNTNLLQCWSSPSVYSAKIKGMNFINDTLYVIIQFDTTSSGSDSTYGVSILSFNCLDFGLAPVSRIDVLSGQSKMVECFLLGRTLYMNGTTKRQTDIIDINLVPIVNNDILSVLSNYSIIRTNQNATILLGTDFSSMACKLQLTEDNNIDLEQYSVVNGTSNLILNISDVGLTSDNKIVVGTTLRISSSSSSRYFSAMQRPESGNEITIKETKGISGFTSVSNICSFFIPDKHMVFRTYKVHESTNYSYYTTYIFEYIVNTSSYFLPGTSSGISGDVNLMYIKALN